MGFLDEREIGESHRHRVHLEDCLVRVIKSKLIERYKYKIGRLFLSIWSEWGTDDICNMVYGR